MERDFRYLRDKHTDAGARNVFEKICTQLLQTKFEDAYPVKICQGDGGIDIFVGDFNKEIDIYQCKYFIDGIGDSQKEQIRGSYTQVINSNQFKVKSWYLCLPGALTIEEHKWWSGWKTRNETMNNIPITLYDGGYLITQLKKYDIYNTAFDDDVRESLDIILSYINSKTQRIYNEIIETINEFELSNYNELIFVKKLENAKIDNVNNCKNDFFNAEIAKHSIMSKGDERNIEVYNKLKMKVYSFWDTQYRLHKSEDDGNELLAYTYQRIEDADTSALTSLDEINLLAKKGMLHQLAEECSVGWLINYKQKLEEYLAKEREEK